MVFVCSWTCVFLCLMNIIHAFIQESLIYAEEFFIWLFVPILNWPFLFYFRQYYSLDVSLFSKEKQKVFKFKREWKRGGNWRSSVGETVIWIYFMKKKIHFLQKKKITWEDKMAIFKLCWQFIQHNKLMDVCHPEP